MTTNTPTSNNIPDSDNTLSNEQWQNIERDLITEKIPVFRDEEDMMQFYQKTALLFCPESYSFPENSKMRLNAQWCKTLCYLNDVDRSLTVIYPILAIILQQKRDLRLLIGTNIPSAEEEAILKEQEQQTETGQEDEA